MVLKCDDDWNRARKKPTRCAQRFAALRKSQQQLRSGRRGQVCRQEMQAYRVKNEKQRLSQVHAPEVGWLRLFVRSFVRGTRFVRSLQWGWQGQKHCTWNVFTLSSRSLLWWMSILRSYQTIIKQTQTDFKCPTCRYKKKMAKAQWTTF